MGEDRDATQDRVTIQEAARRLGVKEDAIRKRIQRGSMRHEKAEDGRVYVWVDTTQDTTQDAGQEAQDTYRDTAQDERLEDLREQVAYLRRQLDEEREARRRADMILAQLAQANAEQARTIRAIEAPQEPPESAETVEEEPDEDDEVDEGADEHDRREGELGPDEEPSIAELREMFVKNRESQSSLEAQQRPQGGVLRGLRRRLLGW
jgi:excisionase family DNA binding protein